MRSHVYNHSTSATCRPPGGRPDLAEKEASELKLLEAYLPAQMTAEELEAIVAAAVAEAGARLHA